MSALAKIINTFANQERCCIESCDKKRVLSRLMNKQQNKRLKVKSTKSYALIASVLVIQGTLSPSALKAQTYGFTPRTGFSDRDKISPRIVLPECPNVEQRANGKLFSPSIKNATEATSSKGSFLVDARSGMGTMNESKFIKLLELAHDKKLGSDKKDVTNEVKCLNYFLKRSNLTQCVDLEISIAKSDAVIKNHPEIQAVYRCSPGKAIFVIRAVTEGMTSTFILDPLRKGTIRAFDARYQLADLYPTVTRRGLYTGNIFISPPGEPKRYGWKNYESASRRGFKFTMGDDATYIFKGSPFWANVFTSDLIGILKGTSGQNSVSPEQQFGLTLEMCSHSCLLKMRANLESTGTFLSPKSFWFNLEKKYFKLYPNGVPIVKSVIQGSAAYKKGIKPGMLIMKAGNYGSIYGIPNAVSIETVRQNLYEKDFVHLGVMLKRKGKPSWETFTLRKRYN